MPRGFVLHSSAVQSRPVLRIDIMSVRSHLIIATRESRLALWQAHHLRDSLAGLYPEARLEILGMTTTGDQILDRTLAAVGGKGLFVKELEVAMREGRAHLAIHSLKDVPMVLPPEFDMIVTGPREDARDAFVSNDYPSLESLPAGAVVGTSSLRRESQLRARFPHLLVKSLRGNLDTRLRKLDAGEYQAIILAAAGLTRLGLAERIRTTIDPADCIPAVGQGALGVEFLIDDCATRAALLPLVDPEATVRVRAERAFSRRLAGSCDVPLGAHATLSGEALRLDGFVAAVDGSRVLRDQISGPAGEAEALGIRLADALLARGAAAILGERDAPH
jgi:hydroxymethylbilane synthase